jgi:hypothetical protein
MNILGKLVFRRKDSVLKFIPPVAKSRRKVVSAFRKSGKYSDGFLVDLSEGLRGSDYFVK